MKPIQLRKRVWSRRTLAIIADLFDIPRESLEHFKGKPLTADQIRLRARLVRVLSEKDKLKV